MTPECYCETVNGRVIVTVSQPSIAEGAIAGLGFGAILGMIPALVFAFGVAYLTRGMCSFGFMLWHLLAVVGGVCFIWLLGGCSGLGLLWLREDFSRRAFGPRTAFHDPLVLMGHAWAGGSAWGAARGALPSVVAGLMLLRRDCQTRQRLLCGHRDSDASALQEDPSCLFSVAEDRYRSKSGERPGRGVGPGSD
jgi:hypothetical protein